MRLVFAGTPVTAVSSLDALLKSRHEVAGVITRPDAKAGRGLKVEQSPIAQRAAEAGIEILQPARMADEEFLSRLRQIAPDCCPVTAYGALIPQVALDIPARGWVNLHFSVLPAWRGAAPVQHAILHGDDITGATTFQIVRALDAGPVYGVLTEAIRPADTAGDLLERLSTAGAELLVATLDGIETGELEAREQPADGVSLAPKITAADAQVDWHQPAAAIDRLIRACTPDPGAWTRLDGVRVKLWPVAVASDFEGEAAPDGGRPLAAGELRVHRDRVVAGTATSPVVLGEVQADGKRRMRAADWVRGLHLADRPAVLG
ncbi:MAG TPA: methionyl-tRNA formyltransferase [Streptosporangiaceae bacterium]|jgi:methionyl-tRNA formyltransferase|nr:methionyl-tRNA formyltransferase [Streptosporangiaceae bacterium]